MLWSSNDVTQQGSRPKTKLGLMKYFIAALFLLIGTAPAIAGTTENSACVDNPPLASLSPADKDAIQATLRIHSDHLCATDACEFRVRKLSNGNTLVKLRAARYAATLQQCVTVYMGHAGVVFDASGKVVDMWPYCYLMDQEKKHDPAFKPDREYKMCNRLGMRPNNSFKPNLLRYTNDMAG